MSWTRDEWKSIGGVALISAVAFGSAWFLSRTSSFRRVSAVVSDEISRSLDFSSNEPVELVRISRDFSKTDLEQLLGTAIPALVSKYATAVIGVDIDFSGRHFDTLANPVARNGPEHDAARVIWSIGFQRTPGSFAAQGPLEICEDCSDQRCLFRFSPKPVFDEGQPPPPGYGLAYIWNDESGVSRESLRFVCSAFTTEPLKTFHFRLVEAFCSSHSSIGTCRSLQPNRQAATKLRAWFLAKPIDLCQLVACDGPALGTPLPPPSPDLSNKIVILYSDLEGNDEHATIAGTRKGAEVEASLVVNELEFGAADERLAEVVKIALEVLMTVLLVILFHWSRTRDFAGILAVVVFVLYLYLALKMSGWVPDFRDYALAATLSVMLEIYAKTVYQTLVHHSAGTPSSSVQVDATRPADETPTRP